MTDDIAAIAERHHECRHDSDTSHCNDDAEYWPCDTARVLAALDAERALADKLAEALGAVAEDDSPLCWCSHPGSGLDHASYCREATGALAAYSEARK